MTEDDNADCYALRLREMDNHQLKAEHISAYAVDSPNQIQTDLIEAEIARRNDFKGAPRYGRQENKT